MARFERVRGVLAQAMPALVTQLDQEEQADLQLHRQLGAVRDLSHSEKEEKEEAEVQQCATASLSVLAQAAEQGPQRGGGR